MSEAKHGHKADSHLALAVMPPEAWHDSVRICATRGEPGGTRGDGARRGRLRQHRDCAGRRLTADSNEAEVRNYLQAAHDRGGGWQMAMRMMAQRIEILEDRMERAGLEIPRPAYLKRD